MAEWKSQSPEQLPPFQGYSLAVLSVALSLGAALLLAQFHYRDVGGLLFLFPIAVSSWYGGRGPAALSVILSTVLFSYFFTEPLYTLYVQPADLPYFLIFVAFGVLVAWFSTIRRRAEAALIQARNKLEIEVAERTQQASLLNLTHDSIFVRDLSDRITYWNRGAQELYGWPAEKAVGQRSHDLLQTVFPGPLDSINAELLREGRWQGELAHTKVDGTTVVVSSRWSLQRDEQG